MKKLLCFSLTLLTCCFTTSAQKQAYNWYFGQGAGLDFNTIPPTVLTNSSMNQLEGCSSISDDNGNLLFYSDGVKVWNKNHIIMTNSLSGLGGNTSSTQSALIVKQPGSQNIYYLFTTDAFNGVNGLQYNIIDMNLNGGFGDVTLKNQLLYTPTTERLSACSHSNGVDVWIMTHETTGNNFVAYRLTNSGLILTPVYSSSDPMLTNSNLDFLGYLKFSPKGDHIAMAEASPDNFWLFDFDPSTGIVSNSIQLMSANSGEGAYGVEFSPNGNVLYGTVELLNKLYQWDISSGNSSTINASRIDLNPQLMNATYAGSLAIAPDGKIYFARNSCEWLGVINDPDVLGTGCNYDDSGIYLQGKKCVYGLPNLNQSLYKPGFLFNNLCVEDSTQFSFNDTSGVLSVIWDFDDPTSGINNTSTLFSPLHLFTGNGNYNVRLIKFYAAANDTVTMLITKDICSPISDFSVSDSLLCGPHCIDFFDQSNNNPGSWQWYFVGASPAASNQQNPTNICYNANGSYDVILIACNLYGCDTFFYPGKINEFTPLDTLWQANDTIWSLPFATYQWFEVSGGIISGANNQYYIPTSTGSYFCIATGSDGCATTSNTIIVVVLKEGYTILPGNGSGTFNLYLNDQMLAADAKLRIFDPLGRIILTYEINNPKSEIVLNVSSGIYFFVIESSVGKYVSKIFVK